MKTQRDNTPDSSCPAACFASTLPGANCSEQESQQLSEKEQRQARWRDFPDSYAPSGTAVRTSQSPDPQHKAAEAAVHRRTRFRELSESDGWRPLEGYRKRRSVWRTTEIDKGQRRQKAERRNNSNHQNRQDCKPGSRVPGRNVRYQQQQQGDPDRDCRNQNPSPPI